MDEKKKLNSAGFCAAMGLLVLAVGVGGYFLLRDRSEPAPQVEVTDPVLQPKAMDETTQTPSASTPVHMPETQAETAKPTEPEPVVETVAPVAPEAPVVPEEPSLVVYPVSGQIVAAFSANELQYSETLGDWRTHDGIDLAAKPGTTVLSASAGTVLSVEDDPLMGTTVRVEHAGGYTTTYANLQSKPPVLAGDEVSAGQIIGAVGETAVAESAQPPHLHFAVEKDGAFQDPEAFLNP